jgi:hypothetical protein
MMETGDDDANEDKVKAPRIFAHFEAADRPVEPGDDDAFSGHDDASPGDGGAPSGDDEVARGMTRWLRS